MIELIATFKLVESVIDSTWYMIDFIGFYNALENCYIFHEIYLQSRIAQTSHLFFFSTAVSQTQKCSSVYFPPTLPR